MPTYYVERDGHIMTTENPECWPSHKRLPTKEGWLRYREQCRQELLAILKPGMTVYTILRSCSKSGMKRTISLFVIPDDGDGKPGVRTINHRVAQLIGAREVDGGIVMTGCGMDMGFSAVYSLGRALWPDGTPEPHGRRNGAPDTDGGYALNHRWA